MNGSESGGVRTVEMKLTVNTQQNTVTVQADPAIIEEIDRLVFEYWDLPRPEGTSKLYNLKYTDPIKVRDMLQELLEQGGVGATRLGEEGGTLGRIPPLRLVKQCPESFPAIGVHWCDSLGRVWGEL